MFGLSFWEIGLILAVALLVFGPSKLPELARSLGKGIREFRKATEDFKSTVNEEIYREPPPEVPKPPQETPAQIPPPAEAQQTSEKQAEKVESEPQADDQDDAKKEIV